jgi:hypothetical protein
MKKRSVNHVKRIKQAVFIGCVLAILTLSASDRIIGVKASPGIAVTATAIDSRMEGLIVRRFLKLM